MDAPGERSPAAAGGPLDDAGRPSAWAAVLDVLADAQAHGFIGAGQDVEQLAEHAAGFVRPIADGVPILDLGSGGGVPGLVVAALRPGDAVVLVDSSVRRTDWLRRAVGRLGWRDRVHVVTAPAEALAHDPAWRGTRRAVVARSFAPPMVTAEVAAGLLQVGGLLVVSEPPVGDPVRWPAAELAALGLRRRPWADERYAVVESVETPPDEVPRPSRVRSHTS
jgi:16S rRNA (guanine527-N7)-methyltransferase